MPVARVHAQRAGVDVSTWIENAVHERAAVEDLEVYEQWKASWTEEDRAVEAALDALDRQADLTS